MGTIVVGAVLVLIVVAIVAKMISDHKNGKGGCSCGCSGCSGSCGCGCEDGK